ncbi:hypothetical protein EVAR_36364_1 [Eumeta japonica]|uniref:Uncharacterized protein n=1 Tax=Eumeta variegata TaxID=151549 RepID=A0A4C1W897_EUMVA|nr:hypothetical protein EVAR_36364_1 [Eumeta japonica]
MLRARAQFIIQVVVSNRVSQSHAASAQSIYMQLPVIWGISAARDSRAADDPGAVYRCFFMKINRGGSSYFVTARTPIAIPPPRRNLYSNVGQVCFDVLNVLNGAVMLQVEEPFGGPRVRGAVRLGSATLESRGQVRRRAQRSVL